jgi:uncharacterized protein
MTAPDFHAFLGRTRERALLDAFTAADAPNATLGVVWGRRRVGKSALLQSLVHDEDGFYHHATRGTSSEALGAFARDISAHLRLPAPLALTTWTQAFEAMLALAADRSMPVVLDEFPYMLEHSPDLDSVVQRLYAPQSAARLGSRARLILCGSSISMMRDLLSGTAPLRGRSGLDLRVSPFDFRAARAFHFIDHLPTAVLTFAVVGGVAAYAREMVDNDLPRTVEDFDRWICERVIAPGRPLLGEMELLLSEDPATARNRKPNLYHATLAAVAQGCHTWSSITKYVGTSGSSLLAVMNTLLAAELVARVEDPVRTNRALYQPIDPFLRFHYAIIRRNPRLARMGTDTRAAWQELIPTFRSLVLGPSFEWMAREWVIAMADASTVGGTPTHVGVTTILSGTDGEQEIDVVAATDSGGATPEERTINALGEAKVGETLSMRHLRRLESARAHFGERAADAKLLLFGATFDDALLAEAERRRDLEIVDLERLYDGVAL